MACDAAARLRVCCRACGHLHGRGRSIRPPPQAVPHEEVVTRRRVRLERALGPAARRGEVIADRARVDRCERIVLFEDQHAVKSVVLRDVRSRDSLRAFDAPEGVSGRSGLRPAEGIVRGRGDRRTHLVSALQLHGSQRSQLVEQRSLERDVIVHTHDALLPHRLDGAEELSDPLVHLRGRIETSDGRRDREDTVCRRRAAAGARARLPPRGRRWMRHAALRTLDPSVRST